MTGCRPLFSLFYFYNFKIEHSHHLIYSVGLLLCSYREYMIKSCSAPTLQWTCTVWLKAVPGLPKAMSQMMNFALEWLSYDIMLRNHPVRQKQGWPYSLCRHWAGMWASVFFRFCQQIVCPHMTVNCSHFCNFISSCQNIYDCSLMRLKN